MIMAPLITGSGPGFLTPERSGDHHPAEKSTRFESTPLATHCCTPASNTNSANPEPATTQCDCRAVFPKRDA